MKKHQKHTALARPVLGEFHQNEWGILGTNCGNIQKLSRTIIKQLSSAYRLGYVDADHKSSDTGEELKIDNALNAGAYLEYTDKIDFHRFDTPQSLNAFQFREMFRSQDGVLVNGNHFKARQQVVVIDQKKKDSLHRKLDRLTNVKAFLFVDTETEIYDFLKEHIKDWASIPTFRLDQSEAIAQWMDSQLKEQIVPINGLVLAGGKSQRMGKDKTKLSYHGVPQTEFVSALLNKYCQEVFVSCRPDQVEEFADFNVIKDTFTGLGPFGAILSAFRENPNCAWLVMAVDIPLVDDDFLRELIAGRDTSKNATAFLNPETGFPDPLITIWEPRSYASMLQFLAQGYSCPRKVLINTEIQLIESSQAGKLRNVNSPEELAAVQEIILKTRQ